MKSSRRILALLTAAAAALALAAPVVALGNYPGETVTLKSKITINSHGNAGKVTASNANCVEQRQVVIKQVGHGKVGSAQTHNNGSWRAKPRYKGAPPLKVYAEVKPIVQGTAGTIYKCLGAKSRTLVIHGG